LWSNPFDHRRDLHFPLVRGAIRQSGWPAGSAALPRAASPTTCRPGDRHAGLDRSRPGDRPGATAVAAEGSRRRRCSPVRGGPADGCPPRRRAGAGRRPRQHWPACGSRRPGARHEHRPDPPPVLAVSRGFGVVAWVLVSLSVGGRPGAGRPLQPPGRAAASSSACTSHWRWRGLIAIAAARPPAAWRLLPESRASPASRCRSFWRASRSGPRSASSAAG